MENINNCPFQDDGDRKQYEFGRKLGLKFYSRRLAANATEVTYREVELNDVDLAILEIAEEKMAHHPMNMLPLYPSISKLKTVGALEGGKERGGQLVGSKVADKVSVEIKNLFDVLKKSCQ